MMFLEGYWSIIVRIGVASSEKKMILLFWSFFNFWSTFSMKAAKLKISLLRNKAKKRGKTQISSRVLSKIQFHLWISLWRNNVWRRNWGRSTDSSKNKRWRTLLQWKAAMVLKAISEIPSSRYKWFSSPTPSPSWFF